MARPKGSKNKQKNVTSDAESSGAEAQGAGPGHNSAAELTDDEQRALAYHHKRAYSTALAKKKEADAGFKNVAKLAKAEGVSVDTIKHLIALDSDEGRAKLEADIQERMKAARWAGVPFGAQVDLFDQPDRTPLVDKAFARGETAALNGEDFPTDYEPGSELGQSCLRGWNKGNASMLSLLKKRETAAPILDRVEADEEGDDSGEEGGLTDEEFDAAAPLAPPTASEGGDPEMPAFLRRAPAPQPATVEG
ncbi:hypothetical protein [Hansschlegelia plantiphila]|uniref:Uncharacterized protein n=1 Tax=Hansschlegelia plantiphila TaxID=374655 RepID=A0A9W6J4M3_9HYPH|nr:hypothetical protein [Hansschlegelia plantiphila]GLK69203.1 hypothetical protein GCM10008179_28410 [Hansschlegelia plantiphila]